MRAVNNKVQLMLSTSLSVTISLVDMLRVVLRSKEWSTIIYLFIGKHFLVMYEDDQQKHIALFTYSPYSPLINNKSIIIYLLVNIWCHYSIEATGTYELMNSTVIIVVIIFYTTGPEVRHSIQGHQIR